MFRHFLAWNRNESPKTIGALAGPALVVISSVVALAYASSMFANKLRDNRMYMNTPPSFSRENNSEKDAFDAIKPFLVVEKTAATLKIVTPGCEERLVSGAEGARDDALKILCDTAPGNLLLDEIDAANSAAQILAIRDDRKSPPDSDETSAARIAEADSRIREAERCDDGSMPGVVIQRGCFGPAKSNLWKAHFANGQAISPVVTSDMEPRAENFRFLAGRITWPTDWVSVKESGFAARAGETPPEFILSSQVAAADVDGLIVQLAGDPVAIGVEGEWRPIEIPFVQEDASQIDASRTPSKPAVAGPAGAPRAHAKPVWPARASFSLHGVKFVISEFCRSRKPADPKLARIESKTRLPCGLDQSRGYELVLSTDTPSDLHLAIRARFQRSPMPKGREIALSRNLAVKCANEKDLPACGNATGPKALQVDWREPKEIEYFDPDASYSITDRNGQSFFAEQSHSLSPVVIESGLTPVLGIADGDGETLNTIVARQAHRRRPGSPAIAVRTTFDLPKQQIVNATLVRTIRDRDAKARAGRGDGVNETRLETRAAVVLMDASDNPGEILAMASTPAMRAGYHIWDVSTLLDSSADGNPFAGQAWRAADSRTMPGSTFKVVNALSAIHEAASVGNSQLDAILRGMPAKSLERIFNVVVDKSDKFNGKYKGHSAIRVPTGDGDGACPETKSGCRAIHNPTKEPTFEYGLDREKLISTCSHAKRGTMGLCEALALSSNLYFVGLARYIDESKLTNGAPRYIEGRTGGLLSIERAGDHLFPMYLKTPVDEAGHPLFPRPHSTPVNLFGDAPAFPDCQKPHRFCAEGIDLYRPEIAHGLRFRLAQAGFGQGFQATPLGMATIYASLGAGRTIEPTILAGRAGKVHAPLLDLPDDQQGRAQEYLGMLRQGLGAVGLGLGTINDGGRQNMRHLGAMFADDDGSPRLFMKTGTAQVKSINSFRPASDKSDGEYTGWLAGWLEPRKKAPPKPTHGRLAFACMVAGGSDSDAGASLCGPIMDEILCRIESESGDQMKCAPAEPRPVLRPRKRRK